MTDFLVSTSDPLSFHRENMQSNPDHYPSWSRLAGAGVVTRVQEDYGAGVWYVTMVNIQGLVGDFLFVVISNEMAGLTNRK